MAKGESELSGGCGEGLSRVKCRRRKSWNFCDRPKINRDLYTKFFERFSLEDTNLHCAERENQCHGETGESSSVSRAVCHGKPCIRGTRVMVSVILDNIAVGVDRTAFLISYLSLKPTDIDAALAYAAELAKEVTIDLPFELSA